MASCKVIRRLALLHHARGFCDKQDVVHKPRSSMDLLAALEEHVRSSGKELLEGLKDVVCLETKIRREREEMWREKVQEKEETWREKVQEKEETWREKVQEKEEMWREKVQEKMEMQLKLLAAQDSALEAKDSALEAKDLALQTLKEQRSTDLVKLLSLKGLNDARGLFERLEEVLAAHAGNPAMKGSHLWEAILNADGTLRRCIEKATKIPAKDVTRQAAHCLTIYNVLSQHIHAGKELAQLQAVKGKILFHRGPMSPEQVHIFMCLGQPEQVHIFMCLGQAANFNLDEDPSTRPC